MCRSNLKIPTAWTFWRVVALLVLTLVWTPRPARAERIRDLVTIVNVFPLQLEGFGVVTGLRGKGDKAKAVLQAIKVYMEKMGIPVNESELAVGNLAYVRVEATLSPWATAGTMIPVRVSAFNGATDLTNGNLLAAELFVGTGREKTYFARAKGKLVVQKEDPVNATLPAGETTGAQVLQDYPARPIDARGVLVLALKHPNAADAAAIAARINGHDFRRMRGGRGFGQEEPALAPMAFALDFGKVEIRVPSGFRQRETEFIDEIFRIDVDLDRPPQLIINVARGSLLLVGDVRIEKRGVASWKGKTVTIGPPPPPGDVNSRVYTLEDGTERGAVELGGYGTEVELKGLLDTLNAMGMEGDDMVEIFRQLRDHGVLRAELVIK